MKVFVSLLLLSFAVIVNAQSRLPTLDSLEQEVWNPIATDGVCSSGTPFQFHARPLAAGDDLLIFFNGGGACWFGAACDLDSEPNVHTPFADMDSNNPALGGGIFDFAHEDNPFTGWNMVVIPYCTGDVHIGAGLKTYSWTNAAGEAVQVETHHNGYANSTTVLEWVYRNHPAPGRILVAGSSAGAIGASFYAGLVAAHYGETPVVLLADAAGGYGSKRLPLTLGAWNAAAILPDWPEYAGQTNDTLTFEDFYIAAAKHNPNLAIAQYNSAEDSVQISFTRLIGDAPDSFTLPQRLLNNYLKIESAVDEFHHYTAGGATHTILASPRFYEYAVEGVRFRDWAAALAAGTPLGDVSCVNEAGGCASAPDDHE